jgi:DNA primase
MTNTVKPLVSRKIPEDFIQTLLARADIVDLVSARVKLKKQGSNYMGCCPFHHEKTASFSVSQTKQFYYCFGCGASGNALGFLMNHDKLEFVEAIEELAHLTGLEVPRVQEFSVSSQSSSQISDNTAKILDVLELASQFYQKQLRVNPSRDVPVNYLKNRGITGEIAQQFCLGYAPSGWGNLLEFLGGTPEKNQILVEAGLVVSGDAGKFYDRFRHRVMFPIRNRKGKVIGFGARAIDPADQPKYLNSPETPVFHKGSELYGLYELRRHRGVAEKIIITEGYMDVIALVQFDVWFSVATLGTATSKTHVETLLKQSRHLIFCFDGDRAGREAAWRALQICLPLMTGDYKIEFLFLPKEDDPDSFIRKYGAETFGTFLSQALPLSEALLSHLKEEFSLDSIESRAQFVRAAVPYLSKLPKGPYQDLLMTAVAEAANISPSQVYYQLERQSAVSETHSDANQKSQESAGVGRPFSKLSTRSSVDMGSKDLVEYVIAWIIQYPVLVQKLEIPDLSGHSPAADLLADLISFIRFNPKVTTGMLLAESRFSAWTDWLSRLAVVEHTVRVDDAISELKGCFQKIIKERDENDLEVLIEKSRSQSLTEAEKARIDYILRKNR